MAAGSGMVTTSIGIAVFPDDGGSVTEWCATPMPLDADRGGFFRVGPTDGQCASRRYIDGTAVLETEFAAARGSARVTDFMHSPRLAHSRLGVDDPHCHRLLRRVEGLSGEIELELAFRPTFDFARAPARLAPTPDGALGTPGLDASVLLMPLVGFLPATDERMRSTVERIRERLTAHGLVYRYHGGDGIVGGEATFAMCTCWLAGNLALQGRFDEAAGLIERVASFASDLGLLSEQIDPASGELLGNYPQGFTHLALIQSALTLGRAQRGVAT